MLLPQLSYTDLIAFIIFLNDSVSLVIAYLPYHFPTVLTVEKKRKRKNNEHHSVPSTL